MLSDLLFRFRALFRHKDLDRELAEELQYHLDRQAEKYRAEEGQVVGLDEAMRRAKVTLGGKEQVTQQCREARGTRFIENVLQDLRYASRQLRRSIGFTLAVILTLALAIGVNSAVFSLLDGFLLRVLPYPHPERVGILMSHVEASNSEMGRHVAEEDDSHNGKTWELLQANLKSVTLASWGGTGGLNMRAGAATGNAVRTIR